MASRGVVDTLKRSGTTKLSATERTQLEKDLHDLKEQLSPAGRPQGDENVQDPGKLQNRAAMESRKRHIEEMLNRDDDLRALSEGDRVRLNNRRKELESEIKKSAITLKQSKFRSVESKDQSMMDFERTVKQQMEHQKTQLANILEWKDIMRRLEPQNPEADNVNVLMYGR